MGAKSWVAAGGILIILGIFLAFAGPFLIPYEVNTQLVDYLVVDSTKSPQFSDWAGGYDIKNNYQMVFYFYNLTNSDDVRLNGVIPTYDVVGPYIYRRFRQSINVSFPDNGNQIEFLDFRDYQYDFNASGGRSSDDVIINVNPVNVAALSIAGSELNMVSAAVGGYLSNFSSYFTGPFISVYNSYKLPSYFSVAMTKAISAINASLNDTTASTQYFLNTWCNSTTIPHTTYNVNWTGLLIPFGGAPTNISITTALNLINPDKPYSLLDSSPLSAWAWAQSLTNATYSALLQNLFNLTALQVSQIGQWKDSLFAPVFIHPDAILAFNLTQIEDLGWQQWTFGTPLGNESMPQVSISDLFPVIEIGYYNEIELFVVEQNGFPSTCFPNWQYTKRVLNATTGLSNAYVFQAFVLEYSNNQGGDYSYLGLDSDQAACFYGYIEWTAGAQVIQVLQDIFGPTGGLILTQSVNDWVFNCNPILQNLLRPDSPPCSFLVNHTVYSNNTIRSGKDDISQINQYIAWQGQEVVSGVWKGDLNVSGATELGQFAPWQKVNGTLQTWDDNFVRTMTLNYVNKSSVGDIPTYQYVLDYKNTFSVSDFFFQSTPGLANMTTVKQSPIFFSLWDMLYVNDTIRKKVVGQMDNTTEYESNTVIDVEPTTGNTVRARQRLQINLNVAANCTWCVESSIFGNGDNINFTADTYFPIAKAGEYVVISSDLSNMLHGKLNLMTEAVKLGFIIGIAAGGALALLGTVLLTVGCRMRSKHSSYSAIQ